MKADTTRGRILLLGAGGQLGTELRRAFGDQDVLALDRSAADLSQPESLRALVREASPSLILNAAAYTAVDRAESEPESADIVNHQAPRVLAEEAEQSGALLIHYSTDYVFDGSKAGPWEETDVPRPLNIYGASKLAGERAIASACAQHLILRTSWLYAAHGHNFVRTMLRLGREKPELKIVNDQWGAPTSAAALARATRLIVDRLESARETQHQAPDPAQWAGIYHATCSGKTTWYSFAEAIFREASRHNNHGWARLRDIPGKDYPTPAQRPLNSVLSNHKLQERFHVHLPEWQDALLEVMEQIQPQMTHLATG